MNGARTAVVTGSTGGIGREVVKLLAGAGWDLVLIDRSADKQAALAAEVEASFPERVVRSKTVDLLDTDQIAQVVAELRQEHDALGALWNIAGLLTEKRITSPQGTEGHFAVNAVAPYALLRGLRPLLAAGAEPRSPSIVVSFSTEAVSSVKALDVGQLRHPPTIGGLFDAYAKTKVAVHALAVFLKDELQRENVFIYSVDPGATKTTMTSGNQAMPWFLRLIAPLIVQPADRQAAKLVSAVKQAADAGQTGLFITSGKRKPHPATVRDERVNDELRALLDSLTESAQLA